MYLCYGEDPKSVFVDRANAVGSGKRTVNEEAANKVGRGFRHPTVFQ